MQSVNFVVLFKVQFCEFIIICRLCPGRPGLRRFYYEKPNSTIIGGYLPFELLQLGPTLCGIAINHISFVLLLCDVLAILRKQRFILRLVVFHQLTSAGSCCWSPKYVTHFTSASGTSCPGCHSYTTMF